MGRVSCINKGHVKVVDRHKPRGLGVKRIEPCPWQTSAVSREITSFARLETRRGNPRI
jgi:hypothetical protein